MGTKRTCRDWTPQDDADLAANYVGKTNEELGLLLNRTPDAVKRHLSHLGLKRPRKADIKEIERKVPRLEFFTTLRKAIKKKKERREIKGEVDKQIKEINTEKVWADKQLQGPKKKKFETPAVREETVPLTIDSRTTVYVPKSWDQAKRLEFKTKYIKDHSI